MTFFIFNFLTIERNSSVTIIGYIYIFNLVIILILIINVRYLKTNFMQIINKNNNFIHKIKNLKFTISLILFIIYFFIVFIFLLELKEILKYQTKIYFQNN